MKLFTFEEPGWPSLGTTRIAVNPQHVISVEEEKDFGIARGEVKLSVRVTLAGVRHRPFVASETFDQFVERLNAALNS